MVLEGFWTEGIWFRRAFGRGLLEWRAFGFGGHLVQGHFFEGIWKEGFWKRAYGWRASDPESGKFMVEIAWWKMYGGKSSDGPNLAGPNMGWTKFGQTKNGLDQKWVDQIWPDQIWVGPNMADQKWPTKSVSTKSGV